MSTRAISAQPGHKEKMMAIEIAHKVSLAIKEDKTKIGSLLCEGLSTSIDVALYSIVYPEFVVIPASGCTDIIKMLPRVRKFSEYPVFAIIDRDNRSKNVIKQLALNGVYATKLPFIENIICCPEVLKIIARKLGLNYQEIIHTVKNSMTGILAEKLRYLNPFNVDLPKESEIQRLRITIDSRDKRVEKNIDLNNVMYTFRDKTIVSEVANALGRRSKEWYYHLIFDELHGSDGHKLAFVMARYLPKIKVQGSVI